MTSRIEQVLVYTPRTDDLYDLFLLNNLHVPGQIDSSDPYDPYDLYDLAHVAGW